MNRMMLLAGVTLLCAACTGNGGEKKQAVPAREAAVQAAPAGAGKFPLPEIPSLLTSPAEREDYLCVHYWDAFDFADTAKVNNPEMAEQGLSDYLALLARTPGGRRRQEESLDRFCAGMERESHAREAFMELMENYLYNPNSPVYDEALYALFLRRMEKSAFVDEARKSSLRFTRMLIGRNAPGSRAEDFVYYLPDGTRRSLHRTVKGSRRLLLLFYDPECPSCHETLHAMTTDPLLAETVKSGKLTVLAVYTEGDEALWKRRRGELPAEWVVGTDREAVKTGALYDLKAMPTLYLLDGQGRVLEKDVPYAKVRREMAGF